MSKANVKSRAGAKLGKKSKSRKETQGKTVKGLHAKAKNAVHGKGKGKKGRKLVVTEKDMNTSSANFAAQLASQHEAIRAEAPVTPSAATDPHTMTEGEFILLLTNSILHPGSYFLTTDEQDKVRSRVSSRLRKQGVNYSTQKLNGGLGVSIHQQ